jgi:hypothetical protein
MLRAFNSFSLLVIAFLAPLSAQSDVHGTWTAEIHQGKVFLQLRTAPPIEWNRSGNRNGDWSMGQSISVDELSGLPANDEHLTAASVSFDVRREAGHLAMQGAFRDGRGAGLFTFVPREAYSGEMRSLGYVEDLPIWRRFQLAVHDVGPTYVRALRTEGFDKLTLDEIQRAKTHGVTIDFIKGIKAEGFPTVSLENLVRSRDHGVTQEYIKAMKAEGLAAPTLEAFVRLRDHGVRADYVADMKGLGLKNLSLEQIVRLRDHGITPGFVNHAKARGFKPVDAEDVIRLKNGGLWKDKP